MQLQPRVDAAYKCRSDHRQAIDAYGDADKIINERLDRLERITTSISDEPPVEKPEPHVLP